MIDKIIQSLHTGISHVDNAVYAAFRGTLLTAAALIAVLIPGAIIFSSYVLIKDLAIKALTWTGEVLATPTLMPLTPPLPEWFSQYAAVSILLIGAVAAAAAILLITGLTVGAVHKALDKALDDDEEEEPYIGGD